MIHKYFPGTFKTSPIPALEKKNIKFAANSLNEKLKISYKRVYENLSFTRVYSSVEK